MGRRAALAALIVVLVSVVTTAAWAYDETGTSPDPSDCAGCHLVEPVSVEATGTSRQGPHAGYTTTSRGCAGCHSTHTQPDEGFLLLPGETLTHTCELCHDGTGGEGVYGTIEARGLTVQSAHRTEITSDVPGGDASTGATAAVLFGGLERALSCGDCHSAHGTGVVEAFTTDRRRTTSDTAGFYSNQLLRRKPGDTTTETAYYGSDWCAACHKGRATGVHEVVNHPVDSGGTLGLFAHDDLQVVTGVGSSQTESGTLGGSNFGYVMPTPRTSGQDGHSPICEQCHEDPRHIGDVAPGSIAATEVFTITGLDGGGSDDNPRFQVFPHESVNASLMVEVDDDLCTNCHDPDNL
jgi:hypothetical protein